jgi:transposase
VTAPADLSKLSDADKDQLILALIGQLAAAQEIIATQASRIAALEARLDELTRPAVARPEARPPCAWRGSPTAQAPARCGPDAASEPGPCGRSQAVRLSKVPGAVFPDAAQTPQQVYERIELPPIKPDVTQVRLFGGRCACCGERVTAEAPAGLEPGSPFGGSIAAMVVYLHYAHAIGMERLATLMDELFSLSISEGAISNILCRARAPLLAAAATIQAVVLASPVVCSDETSARVKGKNWWEWVFVGTRAVLHIIQPSSGKAVVRALFGEIRPEVWVSNVLAGQRGFGECARGIARKIQARPRRMAWR